MAVPKIDFVKSQVRGHKNVYRYMLIVDGVDKGARFKIMESVRNKHGKYYTYNLNGSMDAVHHMTLAEAKYQAIHNYFRIVELYGPE